MSAFSIAECKHSMLLYANIVFKSQVACIKVFLINKREAWDSIRHALIGLSAFSSVDVIICNRLGRLIEDH